MDPILIYSKYSGNSKKLLDHLASFNTTLPMQTLCIDNKKVRERVTANKLLEINSVPCILVPLPGGKVEKFEGEPLLEWISMFIEKVAGISVQSPPVIETSIPEQPQQKPKQAVRFNPEVKESEPQQSRSILKKTGPGKVPVSQPHLPPRTGTQTKPTVQKTRKGPVNPIEPIQDLEELESVPSEQEQQEFTPRTSTANPRYDEEPDLPDLDDAIESQYGDRNITKPPPKRIRKDEGSYEEDPNLFQGEMVDNQRNDMRHIRKSENDSSSGMGNQGSRPDKVSGVNLKMMAEQMASERDNIDSQVFKNINKRG